MREPVAIETATFTLALSSQRARDAWLDVIGTAEAAAQHSVEKLGLEMGAVDEALPGSGMVPP